MKKIIKTAVVIIVVSLACSFSASAQKGHKGMNWDNGWQQRMQSEKIAFLTNEMGLTPAEAQDFWPIYNKMEKERKQSFGRVFSAYKALSDGLDAGKNTQEISELLNKYTEAIKNSHGVEAKYTPIFEKVIPVEKVAKLYIGEEAFRRHQIQKLNSEAK
jgi:Spy/CpxP family protein refolding chaperone